MPDNVNAIPRKVWLLWYQGMSDAPLVVKYCVDSWVRENPDWDVVVLDSGNLHKYVASAPHDAVIATLPLAKRSNLVRLELLSRYGGVWADPTTYCIRPLREWIDEYASSGFFAFANPGPERIMGNWFLASRQQCPLVNRMKERYVAYWTANCFNNEGRFKKRVIRWLSKTLNRSRRTTRYWLSPVVTKVLRVYPYFIFHYLFERVVATDPECRAIWSRTKMISADGPHSLLTFGLCAPLDENTRKEIDDRRIPVYKLTWRCDYEKCSAESVLHYLFEGRLGRSSV
jgi:hypothetical protein